MALRHAPIDFFERFFNLDRSFSTTGNMDFLRSDGSGVNREIPAPFCEGLRGKLPWSAHQEGFPRVIWEIYSQEKTVIISRTSNARSCSSDKFLSSWII